MLHPSLPALPHSGQIMFYLNLKVGSGSFPRMKRIHIHVIVALFLLATPWTGYAGETWYKAVVTSNIASVRSDQGAFIYGTLTHGQHMYVTYVSADNQWLFGYALGHVNKCGWVFHNNTQRDPVNANPPAGAPNCDAIAPWSSSRVTPSYFFSNGGAQFHYGQNCPGSDGRTTQFTGTFWTWWNWDYAHNWGVGPGGFANPQVGYLRYRTSLGWGSGGNGQGLLIRNMSPGDWFFINENGWYFTDPDTAGSWCWF